MNSEELLKFAASWDRGVDPETGVSLEGQRVAVPPKIRSLDRHSTKNTNLNQKERQTLGRSVAEANAPGTLLLDELKFLSKKRAEFLLSLRAMGADDGERWLLVKLQWTVEYWRQRAFRAESRLRGNSEA